MDITSLHEPLRLKTEKTGVSYSPPRGYHFFKSEEKKNQLLVELCTIKYHFYMSETSIFEDQQCEKCFEKYLFNQKMQPKFDQ